MPNVKHTYGNDGKVHIQLGRRTACGYDLNLNPHHWKETTSSVDCEKCKATRN